MTIDKQAIKICDTCGRPVSTGKAQSEVTLYLSESSRCTCIIGDAVPKLVVDEPAEPTDINAQEILGDRFEVISFLGRGGMGAVYKVRDTNTGSYFAVKILSPELVKDQNSVNRFKQEAKIAHSIVHPHLAGVYLFGTGAGDVPFIVMDYLEGTTLKELLTSESYLSHHRVVNIFIQICEAISYAHQHGLIHRDIKPSNIIVTTPHENLECAKVFDFGIAKVMPDKAIDLSQEMTQTGQVMGSPMYMAPEQCRGEDLTPRTDIHAIGCTMYEALTGVHPYAGKNFVETVVNVVTATPPPFEKVRPDYKIPQDIEYVVLKCLAKDPRDRYESVDRLLNDLVKIQAKTPIESKNRKKASGGKKLVAAAAILVIAGAASYFGFGGNLSPLSRTGDENSLPAAVDVQVSFDVTDPMGKAVQERLIRLKSEAKENPNEFISYALDVARSCLQTARKQSDAEALFREALQVYSPLQGNQLNPSAERKLWGFLAEWLAANKGASTTLVKELQNHSDKKELTAPAQKARIDGLKAVVNSYLSFGKYDQATELLDHYLKIAQDAKNIEDASDLERSLLSTLMAKENSQERGRKQAKDFLSWLEGASGKGSLAYVNSAVDYLEVAAKTEQLKGLAESTAQAAVKLIENNQQLEPYTLGRLAEAVNTRKGEPLLIGNLARAAYGNVKLYRVSELSTLTGPIKESLSRMRADGQLSEAEALESFMQVVDKPNSASWQQSICQTMMSKAIKYAAAGNLANANKYKSIAESAFKKAVDLSAESSMSPFQITQFQESYNAQLKELEQNLSRKKESK